MNVLPFPRDLSYYRPYNPSQYTPPFRFHRFVPVCHLLPRLDREYQRIMTMNPIDLTL